VTVIDNKSVSLQILKQEFKNINNMLKLLLLLLLLSITTCTIYNVTPDDNTCHHCHNLQHYLLNATKYFTSNTQLLFLPGLHHLHTNFIIQNVHNISVIGSTTNGTTPDTVIQCDSSVGIVMNNITLLTMKNMKILHCKVSNRLVWAAIIMLYCNFVQLHHLQIMQTDNLSALVGVNILGNSSFHHLTGYGIKLFYNQTQFKSATHTLSVYHYNVTNNSANQNGISLYKGQCTYQLILQVINVHIKDPTSCYKFLNVTTDNIGNSDIVLFSDCAFQDQSKHCEGFLFNFNNVNVYFSHCSFIRNSALIRLNSGQSIAINHCLFITNSILRDDVSLISIKTSNATISHSTFMFNFGCVLQTFPLHYSGNTSGNSITMQNVTFYGNYFITKFIQVSNTQLRMIGPILFFRNVKAH